MCTVKNQGNSSRCSSSSRCGSGSQCGSLFMCAWRVLYLWPHHSSIELSSWSNLFYFVLFTSNLLFLRQKHPNLLFFHSILQFRDTGCSIECVWHGDAMYCPRWCVPKVLITERYQDVFSCRQSRSIVVVMVWYVRQSKVCVVVTLFAHANHTRLPYSMAYITETNPPSAFSYLPELLPNPTTNLPFPLTHTIIVPKRLCRRVPKRQQQQHLPL